MWRPTPLVLVLAVLLAAGCTEPGDSPFVIDAIDEPGDDSSTDEPGDDTPIEVTCVDFETHIVPILDAHNCSASFCHGGDPGSGGINVLTVAEILAGGKTGPGVVPGDPDGSVLINRVGDGTMPPGPATISDVELATLIAWVDPSCDPGGDDTGDAPEPPSEIDFAEDVQPIFEDHGCDASFCHGASAEDGASSGFDIRSPAAILTGGDGGPGVVPCDADASILIQKVDGTFTFGGLMPFGASETIPAEDIEVLRAWVNEGAGETFDASACP